MAEVFHGFELLLLKKFDKHPEQWRDLKQKLSNKENDDQSYTYVDLLMLGVFMLCLLFLAKINAYFLYVIRVIDRCLYDSSLEVPVIS